MFKERRFINQNITEFFSEPEGEVVDVKEAGKENSSLGVKEAQERVAEILMNGDLLKELKNNGLEGEFVESLKKLLKDNRSMLEEIASDKNSDPSVLKYLAELDDASIRMDVARNSNAPADILLKLSEDKDADVRFAVTMNPNTSADTLLRLSEDENGGVRAMAEDPDVRRMFAKNPNTPQEVRERLERK